jgi:hypothetical protein
MVLPLCFRVKSKRLSVMCSTESQAIRDVDISNFVPWNLSAP